MESKLNWVDAAAVRNGPSNSTVWPAKTRYMWDKAEPNAFKVVIPTHYNTWHARTLKMNSKSVLQEDGTEDDELEYSSDWTEKLSLVVMDEGHRLRNPAPPRHINQLQKYTARVTGL